MADVVFYHPTKAGATTTWTADRNPSGNGASGRQRIGRGSMGVTAAGTARGQVIATAERSHINWVWEYMDGSNYDDLEDFYITTCKGGAESFQVDDEYGNTLTVRFMQPVFERTAMYGTTLALSMLQGVQVRLFAEA